MLLLCSDCSSPSQRAWWFHGAWMLFRVWRNKCVAFLGVGKAFESWCSCRFAVLLVVCSWGSGSEAHIFVACGGVNGGDLMVRDSRCSAGPWSASVRSMLLLRNNGNENGSRALVAVVIGAGAAGEIQGWRWFGDGNMVKMEARVFGCVEMKMMTWQHVISSDSLVEIKPTWLVLVGQF